MLTDFLTFFAGSAVVARRRRARALRLGLALLWAAAVYAITLTPIPGEEATLQHALASCLFCGGRGLADAALNIVLFVPLGLLIASRWSLSMAIAAGLAVSLGIELAQLHLPGRNPNFGDVLWNGMGAVMGGSSVPLLRSWLAAGPPLLVRFLAIGLPAISVLAAGWLSEPLRSDARYYGQWTPVTASLEPYHGRVVSAAINDNPIPDGPFPTSADPDRWLAGDWSVDVRVVKGPAPPRLAPIVRIHADVGILFLGADEEDVVWHERTRAQAMRLDYVDPRVRGALSRHAVGDTVSIGVRRVGSEVCIRVDASESCDPGLSPARTRTLLFTTPGARPWLRTLLDLAWMACLFLPLSLLGGGVRATGAAVLVAWGAMVVAIGLGPLVGGSWHEWIGMAAGTAGGVALRHLVPLVVGIEPAS